MAADSTRPPEMAADSTRRPEVTATSQLFRPEGFLGPKLFLADMDATMIVGECMDEMAEAFGLGPRIKAITARAMAGELDFEASLEARLALLEGLPLRELAAIRDGLRFQPGARALLDRLRSLGCHSVLVSGGFTFFADHVAQALGFDRVVANRLEVDDSDPDQPRLTGRALRPYVNAETKLAVLEAEMARLAIGPEAVLAIGDGANDIPMLLRAGWGVAFEGKPKVRALIRSQLGSSEAGGGDHSLLAAMLDT